MDLIRIVFVEWCRLKPDLIGFISEWEKRNKTVRTSYSLKMVCYKEKTKEMISYLSGK